MPTVAALPVLRSPACRFPDSRDRDHPSLPLAPMISFHHHDRIDVARVVRHEAAARRLRLEVPGFRGDRHLASRYEAIAGTWPGVLSASANPRSGRMLVQYAPGAPLLQELRAPSRSRSSSRFTRIRRRADRSPAAAWHALSLTETFELLATSAEGLDDAEAAGRLRAYGHNLDEEGEERSRLSMLVEQVNNVPMALLAGSSGMSLLLGDLREASVILVVIGLNAGIGYRIEHQNETVVQSWRRLEGGVCEVIRSGVLRTVAAADLVPGDVLLVRAGDILPADARLIDAHRLGVDEAPLTGESEPQFKSVEPVDEAAPLGDRESMLYAGTSVASGHGRAVVVATGTQTEVARVRLLATSESAPPPPLSVRMDRLGRQAARFSIGASAVVAGASLLHGRPLRAVARSAVALGVAAIPEGLPLVSTTALVRSMQRLHDRGMVVRRLAAAESLGGVTVICTDKTGTLTCNEMRFEILEVDGRVHDPASIRADRTRLFADPLTTALAAGLLNSDVDVQARGGRGLSIAGSSTESALVDVANAAGLDGAALRREFPRLELHERNRDVHYVISVHETPEGGRVAFLKGAPEQVIELCDLDAASRDRIAARNEALAAQGLRVLALAWRKVERDGDERSSYRYLGLAGLRDPLRTGAREAIAHAAGAGIRTLVLTGDQRSTAAAVANALGLPGEVLRAADLQGLSGEELAARLAEASVVARVTPEEKVAIVRALRASGEIVAMAGDGINDAPALKAADVGVAVGARASDIARGVADVVMSGEDLRGILSAIGEGRIVQDNLRRALHFLFATNLSELALVVGAALVGAREPLGPMQLLWINLLTDTLPGLALALEPGAPEILDRPPAPPDRELLDAGERRAAGRDAFLLAAVGGAGLAIGGPPLAFASLTAAQLGYAFACRAPRHLHGSERPDADRRFATLVGGAIGLQFLALTAPPLRSILGLRAPTSLLLGGFGAGLAAPLLLRGGGEGVVVRRGVSRLDSKEKQA